MLLWNIQTHEVHYMVKIPERLPIFQGAFETVIPKTCLWQNSSCMMIFQLDLNMLNVYTDKTSLWNMKTFEMLKQSGTVTPIMNFHLHHNGKRKCRQNTAVKSTPILTQSLKHLLQHDTNLNEWQMLYYIDDYMGPTPIQLHSCVYICLSFHNLKINGRVHFLGNTSYFLFKKKKKNFFFPS